MRSVLSVIENRCKVKAGIFRSRLEDRKDPAVVETFWAEGTASTKALRQEGMGLAPVRRAVQWSRATKLRNTGGGPEVTQCAGTAWDLAGRQGR